MDKILVLDCGGQYSHLICRRVRDLGVFAEVVNPAISLEEIISKKDVKGLIISGGSSSVYDEASPRIGEQVLKSAIPLLGICYGHQLLAFQDGGVVNKSPAGEFGPATLQLLKSSRILQGTPAECQVWMSHQDHVALLPQGYAIVGSTNRCGVAAFEHENGLRFGVQFHPEVTHTECGNVVLDNFTKKICSAKQEWDNSSILDSLYNDIRSSLRKKKAVIALSGGVDSSTATELLERVVGKQCLTAVYVDSGLMRQGDEEFVRDTFKGMGARLRIVDAKEQFFAALSGIVDPEEKRRRIGKAFIDVFEPVARDVGAEVLIQGTIYSDRIESGVTRHSSRIKSHHNVGALPDRMKLEVYEPLRNLYKDEVRRIARMLGLPEALITRHVFPGPGLAVRIVGEVTPEKVVVCQNANAIVEAELRKANLYEKAWMGFAVLLPFQSVGVQGDGRTYKHAIAVRVIASEDAMTANPVYLPEKVMDSITSRITSEVPSVNRVLFDYTPKPPATMEYE